MAGFGAIVPPFLLLGFKILPLIVCRFKLFCSGAGRSRCVTPTGPLVSLQCLQSLGYRGLALVGAGFECFMLSRGLFCALTGNLDLSVNRRN